MKENRNKRNLNCSIQHNPWDQFAYFLCLPSPARALYTSEWYPVTQCLSVSPTSPSTVHPTAFLNHLHGFIRHRNSTTLHHSPVMWPGVAGSLSHLMAIDGQAVMKVKSDHSAWCTVQDQHTTGVTLLSLTHWVLNWSVSGFSPFYI